MTDAEFKAIVAKQDFAPLVLLAIDLAAWLNTTSDAGNTADMDGALTA